MRVKDSHWHDCSKAVTIAQDRRNQMMDEVQFWLLEHPRESFKFIWSGDAFVIGVRMGDEIEIIDAKPLREKILSLDEPKAAPKKKAATRKATAKATKKKR